MEIWIKERGDDAPIEAALVPLSTWQELWAVANAARAVVASSFADAWGGNDGWGHAEVDPGDLQALADALGVLDEEKQDGNPTVP